MLEVGWGFRLRRISCLRERASAPEGSSPLVRDSIRRNLYRRLYFCGQGRKPGSFAREFCGLAELSLERSLQFHPVAEPDGILPRHLVSLGPSAPPAMRDSRYLNLCLQDRNALFVPGTFHARNFEPIIPCFLERARQLEDDRFPESAMVEAFQVKWFAVSKSHPSVRTKPLASAAAAPVEKNKDREQMTMCETRTAFLTSCFRSAAASFSAQSTCQDRSKSDRWTPARESVVRIRGCKRPQRADRESQDQPKRERRALRRQDPQECSVRAHRSHSARIGLP